MVTCIKLLAYPMPCISPLVVVEALLLRLEDDVLLFLAAIAAAAALLLAVALTGGAAAAAVGAAVKATSAARWWSSASSFSAEVLTGMSGLALAAGDTVVAAVCLAWSPSVRSWTSPSFEGLGAWAARHMYNNAWNGCRPAGGTASMDHGRAGELMQYAYALAEAGPLLNRVASGRATLR